LIVLGAALISYTEKMRAKPEGDERPAPASLTAQ
jgi:hypothetical protein